MGAGCLFLYDSKSYQRNDIDELKQSPILESLEKPILFSQFLSIKTIQEEKKRLINLFNSQGEQNMNMAIATFRKKYMSCAISETMLQLDKNLSIKEANKILRICYEPLIQRNVFIHISSRTVGSIHTCNNMYSIECINQMGDLIEIHVFLPDLEISSFMIKPGYDVQNQKIIFQKAYVKPNTFFGGNCKKNKSEILLYDKVTCIEGHQKIIETFNNDAINSDKNINKSPLQTLVLLIRQKNTDHEDINFHTFEEGIKKIICNLLS